jgi:hypothetical protein
MKSSDQSNGLNVLANYGAAFSIKKDVVPEFILKASKYKDKTSEKIKRVLNTKRKSIL